MVKITKVYTKQGDQGETQLAAGIAIKKSNQRIQVIGEVDELNSFLGWSLAAIQAEDRLNDLFERITRVQNELFNLGSQLAVLAEQRRANTPVIRQTDVDRLEQEIDQLNESLPSLQSFILPGGGEQSTRLHLTRSSCRRAERELVCLAEQEATIEPIMLVYLNRLSDWLFVMARYVAWQLNQTETLWQQS